MSMTTYLETALLNEIFRNTNYAPPATTYVALFTADPTDAGSTTNEITGNAYARARVYLDGATAPYWTAPSSSAGVTSVQNNATVSFPVATGAWGTITYMAIFDAASAGNCLFVGPLTASKVVGTNDQLTFPAGSLVINLD